MQQVVAPTYLEMCTVANLPSLPFRAHLVPTKCVHLGNKFENAALTSALKPDAISAIREPCKDFIVELINQIQSRLPDNMQVFLVLTNFHSKFATAQLKRPLHLWLNTLQIL